MLIGLGLVAGCASTNVPTDVATTGMPNAELALRRTLDQVNSDMTQIGGMQPASTAAAAITANPVMPDELIKPVHFVWKGSLDAGVETLAKSIGSTVAVNAPQNPRPIPVAVKIDGQVIAAFQALGDPAGTVATVQVDPLHHQVEVIHHV